MNNAKSRRLDDLFVMRKGDRLAVCALHTHDLGWEVRLFSGDEMISTQVCRNDAEIEAFTAKYSEDLKKEGRWA